MDVNNLMADAEAKFRTRILNKERSAPRKEQSQIIALSAQFQQLKSKSKKQPIASSADAKATPKRNKSEWAWKNIMPKHGEHVTKEFKGKHY